MSVDMEKAPLHIDSEPVDKAPPRLQPRKALARIAIASVALLAVGRAAYSTLDSLFTPCMGGMHSGLRSPTPTGPIDWEACGKGFECGRLEVPMDYHNSSSGKANLAVGRYLATNKKRLGSVFVNPGGGPGGSGLSFMYRAGPQLSSILDGHYDIVTWDPRGINKTTPRVECFPDKRTQDLYDLEHPGGYEVGNLTSIAGQEQLREQLQITYSESELLSGMCEQYSGDILHHAGTSTVVRDLEYFASVLEGKDTPVNYAGFSYGTAVGSYFVNMFPDRVGRVLIDGVVEPYAWANEASYLWGPRDFQDTDKAFEDFLVACVQAGSERCALAANVTTAGQLNRKIRNLVDDLLVHPLPVPHAARPGLLKSSHVRGAIFSAMYKPRGWPELAEKLASTLAGDGAPFLNDEQGGLNLSDTTSPQRTSSAITAVTCTDNPPLYGKYTPEEAVEELVQAAVTTYEMSPLFGSLSIDAGCFTWRPQESERFVGPWNHTLSNTILVLGNTADPICPVANAREVNAVLTDSRLIIQDGPGHCSLAQASLCTGKVLREYFLEGKLPENGKLCPVTEVLFPPKPPVDNSTSLMSIWDFGAEAISPDDLVLLENLRAFGEAAQEDMRGFKGM